MQQKKPIDLVIGSGKKNSIREFVYEAFKILNIKKNRLRSNTKKFKRKIDIKSYKANTSLAKKTTILRNMRKQIPSSDYLAYMLFIKIASKSGL